MKRTIIHIDQELCNGCGACVSACHEGAIRMQDGKAALIRDDYCDGLGNCLPVCPTGAITFEEREALPFDEEAVRHAKMQQHGVSMPSGCPGVRARQLARHGIDGFDAPAMPSMLRQWPVQIQLVPVSASYFDGADLLVAADCTAYAYAGTHSEFMRGRATVIGCPKLDEVDYQEKLTAILQSNDIRSLTVVRMEVPCCGGIELAARRALQNSGKDIPLTVHTVTVDGNLK